MIAAARGAALSVLLATLTNTVLAQGIDPNAVWRSNNRTVVKIKVSGKNPSGDVVPPRSGSGVIVRPDGTIVTALHVVGKDSDWFDTPGGQVDRTVEIFGLDANGIEHPLGHASAAACSGDTAVLHINASNLPAATVVKVLPRAPSWAIAIVWDPGSAQPEPVPAELVPTQESLYGDDLTLRLAVIEGNSGSPVFNDQGKLIGIITNQLGGVKALAEPAYRFDHCLPPLPDPSQDKVVACIAGQRPVRADRHPFSATNSVRCQNMGDSQSGSTDYAAPPGYAIVGPVEQRNETNYGMVGSVEYVRDGNTVSSVHARFQCQTPAQPFGPGGWAGTTLTGTIERVLGPADEDAMRQECLAQLKDDP